jgi:hypothetical protein
VPSRIEEDADRPPTRSTLYAIIAAGRHGDTPAALQRVVALLPALEKSSDRELLLVGLWGRAEILRRSEAPLPDVATSCDLLEQAAQERLEPLWVAIACALRAIVRLDLGNVSACLADLARIDLDHLGQEVSTPGGGQLLDLLATVYGRLRLHDRADDVRGRAEQSLSTRPPVDRAAHWAHRATELAVRALEPIATGADNLDPRLLRQAGESADQLSTVPPDLVPDLLRRGADAVRALEAAFEADCVARRVLARTASNHRPICLPGTPPGDTAAMHAQALIGGWNRAPWTLIGTAAGVAPYLVLDVCGATERLHL